MAFMWPLLFFLIKCCGVFLAPLVPEGMAVLTQNSLLALACLALYRVHLWREQINPFITFASVSGVTTVGAALSQSQNIAKIFAHVFGTAEAPAEKK
jgi:hypothetical protein